MHLGSKHESEASFSFQINDAVKGDEEHLLAEDDFLRDVNDYTLTTPAPPSRTNVLDHDQPLTLDHLTTATDGHAAASLPNSFAPSSPTGASVHHHAAAVNRRLKTPKRTFAFPSKPSTPKTTRVTRSASKWPSPLREMRLPLPEASPAVAKLTSLRAEIEMLGETDEISPDSAQEQQDGLNSDKRAEFGNRSPLNSNMPTTTKRALPIIEEALTDKDEPYSDCPLATQSAPLGEPSVFDDRDEPVSSYTDVNVENVPKLQEFTASQNLIGGTTDEEGNVDSKNEALKITATVAENENLVGPLTVSQLSPRKCGPTLDSAEIGPAPAGSSSAIALVSPMRPSRKRAVSAVAKDTRHEPNKKGKTAPRTIRHQTHTAKDQGGGNLSRSTRRRIVTPKADGKGQGSVVRRRVSSASRLRSSRLSSSGGAVVPSASLASSSSQGRSGRATRARTASQMGADAGSARKRGDAASRPAKRVAEVRFDADEGAEDESNTAIGEDGTPVGLSSSSDVLEVNPELSRESMRQASVAPKARPAKRSVVAHYRCNDDDADHLTHQEGATNHVNSTAKSNNDFKFEFRAGANPHEENAVPYRKLRSLRTRSFKGSSSTLTASGALSNSRSVGSMTRSQFKYAHHKPVPDFKLQHTLLESSRARRKENVAPPVLPLAFELHTDARARERERFDAMVKEKEMEMEREREVKRREREEQEGREVRELRRRAVPKAHVVPDWYKNAPRRKGRRVGGGGGGDDDDDG